MTSRKKQTPKVTPVSWTDPQNPDIKGWTLKQARVYMSAQKNTPVEVTNTIISPPRLIRQSNSNAPICMIDIAKYISHNDHLPLPLYNHFHTTERTPGGGIHIRWFDDYPK